MSTLFGAEITSMRETVGEIIARRQKKCRWMNRQMAFQVHENGTNFFRLND